MPVHELLTTLGGETVTNTQDWETYRRPEIMNLLAENIYGHRPAAAEKNLNTTWNVLLYHENYKGKPVRYQKVNITAGGYTFLCRGFFPMTEAPVPTFVYIMHEYQENKYNFETSLDCLNVPILDIVSRGYGVAIMPTSGLYPDGDHKADYKAGVFAYFQPDRSLRRDNDWATISAWSWGASRVLDWLTECPWADEKNVAVLGHSRGGKTALWAGATDQRFALTISNASGCSGAMLHRGRTEGGETVEVITKVFDWFCGNYRKFANREEMLPCDQHMLVAAMAPRLCYVASCSEDAWASPAAERESCRLAEDAYKLYGKTGVVLPAEGEVEADTNYHEGSIGYHVKTGAHGILPEDWTRYMDFWDAKRG